MAFVVPTAGEIADSILTNIEARINQSTPLLKKAFNRVISLSLGIAVSGLYKYGTDRVLQSFALTATGVGLDMIGAEYGVTRKPAEKTTLTATLPAVTGTLIPATTDFTSDDTAEIYSVDVDVNAVAGVATLSITSQNTGENTNLGNGALLSIGTSIPDAESTATVTGTTNEGLNRETDTEYRRRVLNEIRTVGGGGNTADYRTWAEQVADVARAFPYSGKPISFQVDSTSVSFVASDNSFNSTTVDFVAENFEPGDVATITGASNPLNAVTVGIVSVATGKVTTDGAFADEAIGAPINIVNQSLPGDRTVFIESRIGDGIPASGLLDDARDSINVDPLTGIARPSLGDTDEKLYVEPVTRSTFDVIITTLQVASAIETQTKNKIETALTTYFGNVAPFITGLDFEADRNDSITDLTVSTVVQDVLQGAGGTADGIAFSISGSVFPSYTLGQGELAELGTISYV